MIDRATLWHYSRDFGYLLIGASIVGAMLAFRISPVFEWFATALGILLICRGAVYPVTQLLRKIDRRLRPFFVYRVLSFLLTPIFKVLGFIFTVLIAAMFGRTSKPASSFTDQKDCTVDDIWNPHSNHYHDKEPPRPFS
jgi:hypothetical protein